jgi:dCMP deaminase
MSTVLPPPSTPPPRASWNEYFTRIAVEVATRATCPRKHVGAVLVRDKSILATGYNGSVRGMPHCEVVGCLMVEGHCARTVHAEVNALAQAARHGVRVDGATAYVTAFPCWICAKALFNAGIARIVYGESYVDRDGAGALVNMTARELGVEVVHLPVDGRPAAPRRWVRPRSRKVWLAVGVLVAMVVVSVVLLVLASHVAPP